MRYLFLISCFSFFTVHVVNGQKPILHSTSLSFERLVSDIDDGLTPNVHTASLLPFNLPKKTFAVNMQTKVDLYKNMVHLLVDIGYDERKALEVFAFFNTDLTGNTGVGSIWTLAKVPTSPQNPDFEEYNSFSTYPEFPNFKYLNLAFIPSYEYRFKRLGVSIGAGIFYNFLLNQEELVFGREWFPWTDFIFEEPFNVSGEISYNKLDIGYIYRGDFSFRVSSRFRLFMNAKYLKSKVVLNTRIEREGSQKWRIWKYGIGIEYIFRMDSNNDYKFFQ